jgi:hypothetical protein
MAQEKVHRWPKKKCTEEVHMAGKSEHDQRSAHDPRISAHMARSKVNNPRKSAQMAPEKVHMPLEKVHMAQETCT